MKKNIETVQGVDVYPAAQQMLIHQGKVLKDGTTLEENKVAENSFIVIMLSKVNLFLFCCIHSCLNFMNYFGCASTIDYFLAWVGWYLESRMLTKKLEFGAVKNCHKLQVFPVTYGYIVLPIYT